MKKSIKRIVVMIFAMVLIVNSIAGCSNKKNNDQKSDLGQLNQTTHLNIAKQLVLGYIPLYIMEKNGWVEEALLEAGYGDVKVTYTEFESGPPENESFAAGHQDLGVMGNVPAISGIAAGQELYIIGIAYNGEKTIGIVVQNNSDIKEISELRGKKIGIVIGSIAQDYLNAMLENSGLKIEDVNLINLGVSELEGALSTGQVDAVAIWNPTMIKISKTGTGKILADGTGVYAGENVIVANKQYVAENPDIVKIFMTQYARAVKELLDHFEQYAVEYTEITGLSDEILIETWENCNFPVVMTEKDQQELEQTAKFLYEQNLIGSEVEIKNYLDFSFSENEEILRILDK